MPNTNSESAQTIITRIQTLISNHAFETDGEQHIHSTFSLVLLSVPRLRTRKIGLRQQIKTYLDLRLL